MKTIANEYAAWLSITVVDFDRKAGFTFYLLPLPSLLAGTKVDIWHRIYQIIRWLRLFLAILPHFTRAYVSIITWLAQPVERPAVLIVPVARLAYLVDLMIFKFLKVQPLDKV